MKNILGILLVIILYSCNTPEVENQYSEALTIEGYVTEGELIKVYLTSSLPFQGEINDRDLLIAEESTAKVTVSNGTTSEILTLTRDDSRYPNLYYQSKTIKGVAGEKYSLNVLLKGVTYSAETTVPSSPILKSAQIIDGGKEGEKSIQLQLENSQKIAYYKVLIKNETEDSFIWADPYLFSTELSDKKEDLNLVLKYTDKVDGVEVNKLYRFNTYTVKLVKISPSEYHFFKSVYGDITTLLNAGAFAENIETNIKGGNDVVGFWAGESRLEFTIEIN